ncbi:MAG TPA: ArgE/DapE family deacylase [Kineosporiaceae bacterium]|nr:ArgE/DapE family deacylase [Kineosporiaceae bacterium]
MQQQMEQAQARVLAAIDESALVATLVELVRIPSLTGSAAESDLQHRIADELIAADLDVDLWSLDLKALSDDPDFPGMEVERTEGYGVAAVTAGAGTAALLLQGHVDVVPVGDPRRWDGFDPFAGRIAGGVLFGRGACDMKAGLAVNLEVVRAIRRSGVRLERPLGFHSVVGEEDGGIGAFATMRRGHVGDACVITEPTSGKLVVANAGALTFRLAVTGRAAHGSARLEGHSAIDAFLPVRAALMELERERNLDRDPLFGNSPLPYPISVGRLRAGDWASSVPDLLEAEGRFGVRLDEDVSAARAAFEAAIAAACERDPWLRGHPVDVSWPGGQFASGRIALDHPLIEETANAVAAVTAGPSPEPIAASYGSDLRLYTGLGKIPTVHYGPGDVRFAHAPREQVPLAEVIQAARAMALLAARRCGAHL